MANFHESLVEWYLQDGRRLQLLKDITNKKTGVSRRALEFLVVNLQAYTRKPILVDTDNGPVELNTLYHSYLQSFDGGKTEMDPFARGGSFELIPGLRTNYRQMNFFRFVIMYNLVDVCRRLQPAIQEAQRSRSRIKLKRKRASRPFALSLTKTRGYSSRPRGISVASAMTSTPIPQTC